MSDQGEFPPTSILMPAFQRDHLLRLGLSSIARQEVPNLEILVLNDGFPSEQTEKIANEYGAKYVFTGRRNIGREQPLWRCPGFALNVGARMAQGRVLVISSPEMWHLGDCIRTLVAPVLENPMVIAMPEVRDDRKGGYLKAVEADLPHDESIYRKCKELNSELPWLQAISRDAFFAVGGYDEDFIGFAYEDTDLVGRLKDYGRRFLKTEARCVHLYHDRKCPIRRHNRNVRHKYNRRLYYERRGIIVRNVGREWGVPEQEGCVDASKYACDGLREKKEGATLNLVEVSDMVRWVSRYDSVLDVGCGTGRILSKVKSRERVGVDICEKALETARAETRGQSNITFKRMALTDLGEESGDKRFECVCGTDILERFEKDKGLDLLKTCESIATKCVLWFVPVGYYPQDDDPWGFGNEYYNAHRSTWYVEDMLTKGYEVWYYPDWHRKRKPPLSSAAMWCLKLKDDPDWKGGGMLHTGLRRRPFRRIRGLGKRFLQALFGSDA